MSRRRIRKPVGLEDLPKEVRAPLLDIMHDHNIDNVEDGLVKMSMLAKENSKPYIDSVEKEAERRYKSRHFTEQNKTIATVQKDALTRADTAYDKGWADCFGNYAISYPCNVCGGLLYVRSNQDSHQAIIGFLREKGWGHAECHNKQ